MKSSSTHTFFHCRDFLGETVQTRIFSNSCMQFRLFASIINIRTNDFKHFTLSMLAGLLMWSIILILTLTFSSQIDVFNNSFRAIKAVYSRPFSGLVTPRCIFFNLFIQHVTHTCICQDTRIAILFVLQHQKFTKPSVIFFNCGSQVCKLLWVPYVLKQEAERVPALPPVVRAVIPTESR